MNDYEERVVAVVEPLSSAGEEELATEVTDIEIKATELVVNNDQQYQDAGEFGVILKQKMAEVTEFFAPMKKAAHDAHKQVCDREKTMLAPLKKAESILKKSMGDYAMKKEQERRAAEEAARRLAQEEADRKLEAAIASERNGDTDELNAAMIDAEIADNASRMVTVESDTPNAKGTRVSKDWEITNIDVSKVPNSVAGVVIRPVDTGEVMRLIRASKGTIQIDGITYKETTKISFRRS